MFILLHFTLQRFFKYLCIASKVSSVVGIAKEALSNGKVSHIINTTTVPSSLAIKLLVCLSNSAKQSNVCLISQFLSPKLKQVKVGRLSPEIQTSGHLKSWKFVIL